MKEPKFEELFSCLLTDYKTTLEKMREVNKEHPDYTTLQTRVAVYMEELKRLCSRHGKSEDYLREKL